MHTVIIGGTSGIGLATARRLATDGHTVTIAGRDADRLAKALAEIGTATGHVADATDRAQLDALFVATGPIDHLVVTVAATGGFGPLLDLAVADLRAGLDGKLVASVNAIQAGRPVLADGGSITLVGAVSAQAAMPGTAGLTAVNGAVETLVPTLALELAPLRVNAVSPGVIDTPWWDGVPAERRDELFRSYEKSSPVGRIGQPEDVAQAVLLLATNGFMTGTVLECAGGTTLATGR